MQFVNFKQNKPTSYFSLISAFLILSLFITPLPAFAQDASSIDTLRQMGKAFAAIAEKASPAVVGIKAKQVVTREYSRTPEEPFGDFFEPFGEDFFKRFFGDDFFRQYRQSPQRRYSQPVPVQGSGFIVSGDGYILTANHLVGEAEDVTVKLADGRDFEAKTIGTDPETDIAVIKINAGNLHFLELANSDALEVGEWVLAIGNPFDLSHTVTAGIVSAKGRSGFRFSGHSPEYQDYIQTDAAINPGNSGGPLLNLDGSVVGINTAMVTGHLAYRGNIGIGFAIPVNMAKAVYEELVNSGTVVRGFLGIANPQTLTPEMAAAFSLKDTKGILVPQIIEGSAAEEAGLKRNDIIVELNDRPIEKENELLNRIAALKPGTNVKVVVLRDGKKRTFTVKLGKRPPSGQIATGQSEELQQLGLTVRNLTDDLAERFGYEDQTGVIVTRVEPGSEAASKGITAGTLIMEVNRKPVKNAKDFDEAVARAAEVGEAVLLLIKQERYPRFVLLKLQKK